MRRTVVMAEFEGKYKLKSSENFDGFLSTLGVNPLLRTIGGYTKPTMVVIVTNDGTHFQFKQSSSTFRKYDLEFDLGKTFEHRTIDGRMVKSTVVLEDNRRLVQRDRANNPDEKDTTFIREINGDGDLVMTCQVDDVASTRLYERIS